MHKIPDEILKLFDALMKQKPLPSFFTHCRKWFRVGVRINHVAVSMW